MSLVARLSSAFGTPEAAQTARRGPKSRRKCFTSGLPFHSQIFHIFPDTKLIGRRYDHSLTRASKGPGPLEQSDDPAAFLNEVANKVLRVMMNEDKKLSMRLAAELDSATTITTTTSMDEADARFLRVLQGMLRGSVPKEASQLQGQHLRAFNRMCNQLAGGNWQLLEEGKAAPDAQPQFAKWEDFLHKEAGSNGAQPATGSNSRGAASSSSSGNNFYRVLGVEPDATSAQIKAAFRQKALEVHPDVSNDPDAEERFKLLARAYDVLFDNETRALYDKYGEAGLEGGAAGRGHWSEAWDEFKPFVKKSRRSDARDAASASAAGSGPSASASTMLPQVGDVVEYPLREVEQKELRDGRTAGVGLLVSRNMDRADADSLPPHLKDMCEIESLRQDYPGSNMWRPDDLGIPSFAELSQLRVVPVTKFDRRHDLWQIDAQFSEGCGGPELPEEVML
eukprot:jgi/Botrbrau1/539/Bobra.0010s0014.1